MKILLITNTPPIPSWGGAMTFFRHFCEKKDFEIQVITDNTDILKYEVPYEYQIVNHGKIFQRLSKTRFARIPHTYANIFGPRVIHSSVHKTIKKFHPEAIFTVAGSWSWMAILAQKVSEQYSLPLIGSFNDWWKYNNIYHPLFEKRIEQRFLKFYKQCDLVLCTSEGMYEELGPHQNYLISYPTGTYMPEEPSKNSLTTKKTLAFGGNLGDWYGEMLEKIISHTDLDKYEFKIFGSNPSWSSKFDTFIREKNFYKGQVPFEELKEEMSKVDGLLLLMGFGTNNAQVERTSFKTKFLDYLTFQKPIFLWGPAYCSAYRTSEEFDSTARSSSENVEDFIMLFDRTFSSPDRIEILLDNCRKMYQNRFHPELIHSKLLEKIHKLSS